MQGVVRLKSRAAVTVRGHGPKPLHAFPAQPITRRARRIIAGY
jgi:hypothetical protein